MADAKGMNGWGPMIGQFIVGLAGAVSIIGFIVTPLKEQQQLTNQQVQELRAKSDDIIEMVSGGRLDRIENIGLQSQEKIENILTHGSPSGTQALKDLVERFTVHERSQQSLVTTLAGIERAWPETVREIETQFREVNTRLSAELAAVRQRIEAAGEKIDNELGHVNRRLSPIEGKLFGNGIEKNP